MKNFFIIGLFIFSHSAFAQIPGKKIDGPILIFDTLTLKKGDVILLGKGSDPTSGDFRYITTPQKKLINVPNKLLGIGTHTEYKTIAEGISYAYHGNAYPIESFSKVTSKNKPDELSGVITIGASFEKLDQEIYKQAVNFEAAIQAGEIIKINEHDFTKRSNKLKLVIPQFTFTPEGVPPIEIVVEGVSKPELYARTLRWYNNHDHYQDENFMTSVDNEAVKIVGRRKGVLVSRILGVDLFGDVEYRFHIDMHESGMRLSFITGSADGQITEGVTQEDYFDKNGQVKKPFENFKRTLEQLMNELSASLVDYVLNNQ
ncbi:MAG: hypothetical protein JNM78_09075 [Cyclobacteriaceae bacterium]|nr:hypothetical protein [Cyclobacteriaceae bacterium]